MRRWKRTHCLLRLHEGSTISIRWVATSRSPSCPPYSPDLNPVEYLWAWLKRHVLANYCPNDLSELHITARDKLKSAQERPSDHRRPRHQRHGWLRHGRDIGGLGVACPVEGAQALGVSVEHGAPQQRRQQQLVLHGDMPPWLGGARRNASTSRYGWAAPGQCCICTTPVASATDAIANGWVGQAGLCQPTAGWIRWSCAGGAEGCLGRRGSGARRERQAILSRFPYDSHRPCRDLEWTVLH